MCVLPVSIIDEEDAKKNIIKQLSETKLFHKLTNIQVCFHHRLKGHPMFAQIHHKY
jgi:hypothetical protein